MTDPGKDSEQALTAAIGRYNEAWNAHDLDAIVALHAPDMVFENHTAGESATGAEVRSHIAAIFAADSSSRRWACHPYRSWPATQLGYSAVIRAAITSRARSMSSRSPAVMRAAYRQSSINVYSAPRAI